VANTPTDSGPSTAAPAPAAPAPAGNVRRGRSAEVHEVTFVAYPKLLFVWPLILMGLVFWPIAHWGGNSDALLSTLGWIYVLVTVFVVLTLGVDVDRNQAVFWVVLLLALWLLGLVLKDRAGITVFGNLYRFFQDLNVRYDKGFGLALSLILLVPFLLMLVWARLNDRWRITHNEFEHYSFGRMDDSLGRGAKTIRTSFPDVFEAILGLAGTLEVYNATGTQKLREIPHVMFLPFIRARLGKVLERMAVTDAAAAQAEEEEG
jgi:hypothetical protein